MNQAESNKPQKSAPAIKLMAIVCLRILGFRKKQFNENEFEQLTGIQVGIACLLALVGFTVIIGLISILAVKTMS
jgi:hypothetical protein